MDVEIEVLLRAHLRASRELLSLHKPGDTVESAAPVLQTNLQVISQMREMENKDAVPAQDRESLRDHINISRRLIRMKAREFRFAYVDPEDGEGGSPLYARILPVPPSLFRDDSNEIRFNN